MCVCGRLRVKGIVDLGFRTFRKKGYNSRMT